MTNEEFIQSIALPGEEWRDVPNYEELYMVSSYGRIASLRTEFFYKNRKKPRIVQRMVLKPIKSKTSNGGYYTVILSIHKKTKLFYIHRLVATAFVENPNPSLFSEVDHIDGNPHNNNAINLKWTNRSGNMKNPIASKRQHDSHIGKIREYERKPFVRISADNTIKHYTVIKDAEAEGFTASAVNMCCNGKKKTYKGFRWVFKSDYESQVSMSKNSNA